MVPSFKYLGIVLSTADDGWTSMLRNLKNVQVVWRRMSRILNREEEKPQVSEFLFKSVVHPVLLFGVETWVVIPCMGRVLGGLQYQVGW